MLSFITCPSPARTCRTLGSKNKLDPFRFFFAFTVRIARLPNLCIARRPFIEEAS